MLVYLNSLFDNASSSYLNAATVTGVLLDNAGNTAYSFDLTYVSSSSGNYVGTIPASTTATLTPRTYTIKLTAVQSGTTLVLEQFHSANYAVG